MQPSRERRERLLDELWAWEHRQRMPHRLGGNYAIFYVPSRKTQIFTLAKRCRLGSKHRDYRHIYTTLKFGDSVEQLEVSVSV